MSAINQKPTFDWSECLRLNANKDELANEILVLFKNELPEYKIKLRKAAANNDKDELKSSVHKLHGACCYTGVPRLRALAELLELQVNDKTLDELKPLINDIDHEIDCVLEVLNER